MQIYSSNESNNYIRKLDNEMIWKWFCFIDSNLKLQTQ